MAKMMIRVESIRICGIAILMVLPLWGLGCSDEGDSQVNSQTHWLNPCDTNDDCEGQYDCLCGVCTVTCAVGDACAPDDPAGEGDSAGFCVTPGSSVGLALCDAPSTGGDATGAGLCLSECDVAAGRECPDSLLCVDGACVRDPNPSCAHSPEPDVECANGLAAEPEVDSEGCIIDWVCANPGDVCLEPEAVACGDDMMAGTVVDGDGCITNVCRNIDCSVGEGFLLAEVPVANMSDIQDAYEACEAMAGDCGENYQLRTNQTFPTDQGLPVVLCECACADPNVEQCTPGNQVNLGEFVYDASDEESLRIANQDCLTQVEQSALCKEGSNISIALLETNGPQRLSCACTCPDDNPNTCHRGSATAIDRFSTTNPEELEDAYAMCMAQGTNCEPGYTMEVIGTQEADQIEVNCVCVCNGGGVCENAPFPARDFCTGPSYPVPVYDGSSCAIDWTCVSRECPPTNEIMCDPDTEELVISEDGFGCTMAECQRRSDISEMFPCGDIECRRGAELCQTVEQGEPTDGVCIEIPQECSNNGDPPECVCITEMLAPEGICDVRNDGETHLTIP